MCEIKYHVKLPIFVARQWIRHRTANVNEYSARYSILDKEFYLPTSENLATQSKSNRQGRGNILEGDQAKKVLDLLKNDAERTYNNYEMILREVDHDGLEDEAAARVFSNPLQLIRFLRNSSDASCPWIRESRKWININPCLDRVSSNGEHTGIGGRVKITQSPSRFLIERCLTHVDKTLDRIYQLKKEIFARVPAPASSGGRLRFVV